MHLPSRPEDRQRSREPGPCWADTEPLAWRSEAFAEDLPHGQDARDDAARGTRDGFRGHAAMPLLGLALAAVLGALGR